MNFEFYNEIAPVFEEKRQVGDLQCNLDRAEIVGALVVMQGTVNSLKTETAS